MKSLRLKPCAAAVAVAALQMANPAYAVNCTWIPGTGDWGTPGNWSCGVRAGVNDAATIGLGKTVTVSQAEQITTLTNAGTININAFTLSLLGGGSTTNTGTINVGGPSTAALQVQNNITNTGGTINVGAGSVINQFGVSIAGGTINTTGTGKLVASNSGGNFLSGVTLNGNLDLATNTGIERVSGGMTLNGLASIDNNSVLAFEGDQTLGGSGTIAFGNTGASNRLNLEAGNLTIGSGIVVRGENGTIGNQVFVGGASTLTNNGRISADVAGGQINLAVNGTVTNNGTLEAKNGGTLVLSSNIVGNPGSAINAAAGSLVLQNNVALSGTINTTGTGSFRASNSGSNFLNGVALNGTIDLATNTGIERVAGGLTLASGSAINVNNNSVLAFQGDQTLGGNGTIVFGNTGASNRLNVEAGNLTIGSGIVVRGESGTIGNRVFVGGPATLTNNGRISADVASGTVTLAVQGTVTNNGTLEAQNGGTLILNNSIIGNAGSHIDVGAGSTVLQNGVTLQGVINSAGGGNLRASNSTSNVFDHVSLTGALDLATQTGIEVVRNNLTLNGSVGINLNSALAFVGDQTVSGTGTIVFGSTGASNRVTVEAGNLVLGSGTTIRGENGTVGGQIISGGPSTLTNNGRISADVNGGTVNLGINGLTTNNGILEAKNGGTLVLNSNIAGTSSGSINAAAGSTVVQNGIVISGIVNTTGSGTFAVSNSSTNVFDAVTLNGNVNLSNNTGIERVRNGLALNGNITINNNSVLGFEGDQTLSGAGTITFGNTGAGNRMTVEAGVLTLASTALIHGENGTVGGQVFTGGPATLNNNGRISADVVNGTVNLTVNGTTNNAGTLEARNGGTLVLSSGIANTAAGQINAVGAGSRVVQGGVTISGGTIGSSGGTFVATNTSTNFLSGVTLAGSVDLATNTGIERVVNGLAFAGGTFNVNNNSVLSLEGNQTLTGTGTIVLGNSGPGNRVAIDGGNVTLGSGVTIRGESGTIGQQLLVGGPASLTNNGTIRADVSGGVIALQSPGALVNGGTLGAANGGTLNITSAFTGTGIVSTASGGIVALAANSISSSAGRLTNDGSLALGTNNLTISNDYSNANFGSGNAFNKRSNISGAGLVLSSGSATAQAVTGTSVTNGGTATPTLTIGNVRVGATTLNYQVANTDASGPSLRGAIQTSVNGGNITDARLSGSGVTAGNYGPVAGGSSSGNLGVTFTAASAGALAPLAGQSVHIANNFSNVGEQTLNIALASGAAAYNVAVGSTTPSPVTIANQRVGGTNSSALTVANTAAAGNFTEALNASFGGATGSATTNGGNLTNLAAGSSNNSALSVGVNTSTSGARTGTVNIAYQSDGTGSNGHSGLSAISAGSQTVNVSGNVYQAAAGTITTAPLSFGTVQVGQVVSQNLTVRNTATGASGFVEDLNASFGAATGTGSNLITGTGSASGILAGASGGGLTVGVNTAAAGVVNGSIAVNFFSAGAVAGVSNGLGTLAVGSANYGVAGTIQATANVVNQASPVINNSPIALGNVRINSASPTGIVSVTNQATASPQAALNASISGNGGITGSGSFNLLNPGATNNTNLTVGLNTAVAGNQSGNATIAFVSDASNIGGCEPNCQLTLASQNVAVTGAVYRLANPGANPTTVTVAGRVGSVSPTTAINITNASPDIYTEGLSVTRGATSAGFNSTGSITNLAAAGSSTAIGVTLNTTTAGTFTGTQALNYVSTGAGTTGAADISVGSGSVTLNGKVYTTAVATNNTPAVNFGIVHVGDTATRSVSVSNSAGVSALNDTLVASAAGATGPFTSAGSVSNLAAGATSTALSVGLNTATAGVYSGSAAFSAASHDADLSDAALANLAVSLSGQVNNYATDRFSFGSGAGSLTQVGSTYVLDYGTVAQNSGTRSTTLTAGNSASGPADLLDGSFQFLDPADFAESGFASFLGLAAGQTTGPLTLSFDSLTVGSFMDTIVLHGVGYNTSGYSAALGDIQLVIRGVVTGSVVPPINGVPEPDSLILLGLGIPLLFLRRSRKSARKS